MSASRARHVLGGISTSRPSSHAENETTCWPDSVSDYIGDISNRVFRSLFSISRDGDQAAILEIRETFNEDGPIEVRARDIDPQSECYGSVVIFLAAPKSNNEYDIVYEVRTPLSVKKTTIPSPLVVSIADLEPTLGDLSVPPSTLGKLDSQVGRNPLNTNLYWPAGGRRNNSLFEEFTRNLNQGKFSKWARNVQTFERFGDFRDKCVHPRHEFDWAI